MKDKVFAHNPTSIEELKVKIAEAIYSINVQMLQKAFWEFAEASSGMSGSGRGHFEHLL